VIRYIDRYIIWHVIQIHHPSHFYLSLQPNTKRVDPVPCQPNRKWSHLISSYPRKRRRNHPTPTKRYLNYRVIPGPWLPAFFLLGTRPTTRSCRTAQQMCTDMNSEQLLANLAAGWMHPWSLVNNIQLLRTKYSYCVGRGSWWAFHQYFTHTHATLPFSMAIARCCSARGRRCTGTWCLVVQLFFWLALARSDCLNMETLNDEAWKSTAHQRVPCLET
jgi:hypothetical protein